MNKKKTPDYSYIDNLQQQINRNKQIFNSGFNAEEYSRVMSTPEYTGAPDDYGFFEHTSDAFSDFNSKRTATKADTAYGDAIKGIEDLDALLGLKEYLQAQEQITPLIQQKQNDPNNKELNDHIQQLYSIMEQNKKHLDTVLNQSMWSDSVLKEGFGTKISDRIINAISKGDYKSVYEEIDKQTNGDIEGTLQYKIQQSNKEGDEYARESKEWDDKISSDYYRRKSQTSGFDLGDIDTYLYKVPGLMGSSAATLLTDIGSGVAASLAGGATGTAIGGPVGTAVGALVGGVIGLGGSIWSRIQESNSEIYSNYKSKVQSLLEKDKSEDKVLNKAKDEMKRLGYTDEQINDRDFVYNQLLTGRVKINDQKFNQQVADSFLGLKSLYTDNMALSASDVAQTMIAITPLNTLAKATGIAKLGKAVGITKALDKGNGLKQQLSKKLDDITAYGLEGLPKLNTLTKRKAVRDLAGKLVVTSVMEGAEEGVQYIKGKNYIEGKMDTDPNIIKSIVTNFVTGARSVYAALTPWDPVYSTDEEFMENFKGGALLGGLMGGTISAVSTVRDTRAQLKANDVLKSLLSDKLAYTDSTNKNLTYAKAIKEARVDKINNAFDELKSITKDSEELSAIDTERNRFNDFVNIYSSKRMIDLAASSGIDIRTDKYDKMVSLFTHAREMYNEAKQNDSKQSIELNKVFSDPKIEEHIKSILLDSTQDQIAQAKQLISDYAYINKQIEFVNRLDETIKKQEEFELNTNIQTSKADLIKSKDLLANKNELEAQKFKLLQEANKLGLSEKDLEIPTLHNQINEAIENKIVTELDLKRATLELSPFITGDTKTVLKKIELFDSVQEANHAYADRIEDKHQGKDTTPKQEDTEDLVQEPFEEEKNEPEKPIQQEKPNKPNEPQGGSGEAAVVENKPTQQPSEQPTDSTEPVKQPVQQPVQNKVDTPNTERYMRAIDQNGNEMHIYNEGEFINPGVLDQQAYEQIADDIDNDAKVELKYTTVHKDGTVNGHIVVHNTDGSTKELDVNFIADPDTNKPISKTTTKQEVKEENTTEQQEQQASKELEQIKEKEVEQTNTQNDTTPVDESDVTPVSPEKTEETEPAKVDNTKLTLADILGELAGEDAAKALSPEQSIPEEVKQENQELPPLSYDRTVDKYSHQLIYHIVKMAQDALGKWIPVPQKYRGKAEVWLNNDEFAKVSAKKGFLKAALKNGVYFEVLDSAESSDGKDIYCVFTYNKKKYAAYILTEKGMQTFLNRRGGTKYTYAEQQTILQNLRDLRNKILTLHEQAKKNPNLRIVPTQIRRTTGSLVNVKDDSGNSVNKKLTDSVWMKEKDPYKISPENTNVAISTGPTGQEIIRFNNTIVSSKGDTMGKPVWMIEVPGDDGKLAKKLVMLNYKSFKDEPETVDLILVLLTNLGKKFVDKNGVETNVLCDNILRFLVNFDPRTATNPNDTKFTPSQLANRMAKQFYQDDKGNIVIGTEVYTISDLISNPAVRERAKKYIQENFHYNIDEYSLSTYYFGGGLQNDFREPTLAGLDVFLKNSEADKIVLVPGKIEFTLKDFGLTKDENGNKIEDSNLPNGISSLGWYIKQGVLLTDISDEFQDANLYVDDVTLVDINDENTKEKASDNLQKATEQTKDESAPLTYVDENGNERTIDMDDIYNILGGPNKEVEPNPNVATNDLMNEQEAREWLESTLGITPEILDSVIETTEAGTQVVGRVIEDSILLSKQAPRGTEYHEGWHRVSQLCISEKERRRIYDRYNRKNNTNLNDVQLDEIFAEKFREFMETESAKYEFDTNNWFKRILNFIRLWANTGSFALARIYSNINRGKYRGIKPSKENIERFRKIYQGEGPNFELYGYNFKTITNLKQVNDIAASLTYAFFRVSFAEGKTINIKDLQEDKPAFDTLKLMVQGQLYKFPSEALQEVYDSFDTVFLPLVQSNLKQMGIRSFEIAEQDKSNIEEGAKGINIGQHTVEGMNISIKDTAPAEVKLFFQTIPLYEIDGDGKYRVAIDPVTKFARFVDAKKAWDNILKDLSGCRTIANIVRKVQILSTNDLFYRALLVKLTDVIKQSINEDPKIAINAEALLTKLSTVITSDINNYITAKISKNKLSGKTEMALVDNSTDVKAIAYPRVWSSNLFYNSGVFAYTPEGKIVAADKAKEWLKNRIDFLNAIKTAFINNKGILKVRGRSVDLNIPANQEWLKDQLVQVYQDLGIGIDKPTINRMLLSGDYGKPTNSAYQLLSTFVTGTMHFGGLSKVIEIAKQLHNSIDNNGNLSDIVLQDGTKVEPRNIWNNVGYIKALANYYAYVHATDKGLSSLGPDGNSYYMVSQNNFVKDRVNELQNDSNVRDELNSVVYNGNSIILDAVNKGNRKLQVETFINFKDTTSQDAGRDYFGITDREDYIAKMTAVFDDRIIFPTVADKKTYHFIKGINLPHEAVNFSVFRNGDITQYNVQYGDQALDILYGYCIDELNQIELCLRQIDDDPKHFDKETGIHYNEDGTINRDWLDPKQRIKNFHTPNEYSYTDENGKKHNVTLEGNGARFLFLTGVYVNGKFESFNDPSKSAKENLQKAKDLFFNAPKQAQKQMLSTLINQRVKQEIATCKSLGLIEGQGIWSLRNKLLDSNELESRKSRYETLDANNAEGYAIFDMIADYTINSIISVCEIEKLFNGAPAYYKVKYDRNGITDMSVDKIKRLGALTSTGLNNRLDFFNDPIRQEYTVAELKDHEIQDKQYYELEGLFYKGNLKETIQEMVGEDAWDKVKNLSVQEIEKEYPQQAKIAKAAAKVEVAGYKEGINVADAAVYISPTMARDMLRMRGEWNADIAKAFDILTNPETADKWESDPKLYAQANKVILNAMKYMAFGTRFRNGLGIPYFNKMALFPLFKSIATGDMKALYDRMTDPNNPIDMVLFDSAVKAGSQSPMKAYRSAKDSEIELKDGQTVLSAKLTDQLESGEGNTLNDFNQLVTYKQPFKYLRQQLATDPHIHEDSMAGTQFMKVNLSNIRMNDSYGKEGDQVSGKEIKETVMDCLNKLSDLGKQELMDQIFTEYGQVDIDKLANILKDDAKESGANDNVMTGLNTKDGDFIMPLPALSDNKWIESRFISMINKAVVDVYTPGGAFIQRSAFGIEATSTNVISEKMINDGKPLLMINEKDGSMDSVISINLLKHIIPNYNKMTFAQARQWLLDHNIIGQNAEANAIGYRIPTQSVASISALRFVDVLPEIMGDTIVLPEGFTKLTGSDFDIDKLYVARFAYDGNGNKIDENGDSKEAYANRLLHSYMRVLLTKDNTNSLKISIDNATENVKAVLKDIEGKSNYYPQPFEVYSPTYQEARKAEYTGGKAGIGPFALNNAHHILTQLTGLKMVDNEFTEALKIRDLDRIYDVPTVGTPKGGRILDWLSAMINGFVDIAKDPYIVRLNVNSWTYNMVSFLLRTGKGKQTFYFMCQPILKEMADAVIKTKGKYGIDRTKTPSQLEREAIESVLDKYDPEKKLRKQYEAINRDPKLAAKEYYDLFETYMVDNKETSRAREVLFGQNTNPARFNQEQVRFYYAFLAIKPYADSLANLVKYSKIDTKKTGKSFAEQQTYYNGMWAMTEDPNFEEGAIERFYNETFIARKTENSIPFGSGIFKDLLFRNTNNFLKQKDAILSLLGRKNNADNKLLNSIISAMEAQIKSEFFNQFVRDNDINVSELFKGRKSIAKRLNKFKSEILKGNPKYKTYLNADGTIANDFLNFLLPNINEDSIDFIDTSEVLNADQASANNLINYWRELLDDPTPEIKRLARDLVVYAFYTSGDNPAMNSFFQYVPNSWRIENGYTEFVSNKLKKLVDETYEGNIDKEDLFLNNWNNDKLVKPVNYYARNNDTLLSIFNPNKKENLPLIVAGVRHNSNDKLAINPLNWVKLPDQNGRIQSYPLYPPYIKMNDNLGNEPKNWFVYRLFGFYTTTDETGNKVTYVPVYGRVPKKGYKYRGHQMVEYGSNTRLDFNQVDYWDYDGMLSSGYDLSKIASDYEKLMWENIQLQNVNELPSYREANYMFQEQERVYEEDVEDVNDDYNAPLEEKEEATEVIEIKQTEISLNEIQKMKAIDLKDYTLHSGGAYGADTMWDIIGREFGLVNANHYRDSDNISLSKQLRNNKINAAILTKEQMDYARNQLEQILNVKYSDTLQGNLQVRNYYQVANSDSVFAIAALNDNKNGVTGGTNTAVQLGIKLNKPTYVWDIVTEQWYIYNTTTSKFTETDTPTLTKNFAGVGTRDIENYQVFNKNTNSWSTRSQYVGDDKAIKAAKAIREVYRSTLQRVFDNTLQKEVDAIQNSRKLITTNTQVLNIVELYDKGNKAIEQVLNTMDITDKEKSEYLHEFNNMLREENVSTPEELEGLINKFICNL